jgi:putative transposase
MVSAPARREQARYAMSRGLGARAACALVGTPRSALEYEARLPARDSSLSQRLRQLALRHRRYGYRRIAALLRREGEVVNDKRVHRLWKREGLALARRRPRRRLPKRGPVMPDHDGAPNVVWAADFVHDSCANGEILRCLTLIDEGTRECIALSVEASQPARRVIATLEQVIKERGKPTFLRTDNGPEFIAHDLEEWTKKHGITHTFNEPGKPWQNGKNESFNGRFRDECLNMERFSSRREARVIISQWRTQYNEERPHSGINYSTPNEKRLAYKPHVDKIVEEVGLT